MLVFSLRRGQAFYVRDQRVQLLSFDGARARVRTLGRALDLTGDPVELPGQPRVRVSVGRRQDGAVRVGVDAPLEIKVLRERLYLAAQAGHRPEPRGARRHHARAMGCRLCRGTMTCAAPDDGREIPCPAAADPSLTVCEP